MQNGIKIFIILISLFITVLEAKVTTSIALVGMSMDYREYDQNGKILDSEKSNFIDLLGYEANLAFIFLESKRSKNSIDFTLMSVNGETEYKGSYIGSSLGYGSLVGSSKNHIVDTEIRYKRANIVNNSLEIFFGVGVGYRYWERGLSASQIEIYTWFYATPSIGLHYAISPKIGFGTSLEYQYAISPQMSETAYDLDFDLGSTDIKELNIFLSYSISEKLEIYAEATFQEQIIEASDVEYNSSGDGYYEPDSTANNQYLKIGLTLKY